jgi:hypothetical protein
VVTSNWTRCMGHARSVPSSAPMSSGPFMILSAGRPRNSATVIAHDDFAPPLLAACFNPPGAIPLASLPPASWAFLKSA